MLGDAILEVEAASKAVDTNTNGGNGVTRALKARRTPSEAEANRTKDDSLLHVRTDMPSTVNNVNTVKFLFNM